MRTWLCRRAWAEAELLDMPEAGPATASPEALVAAAEALGRRRLAVAVRALDDGGAAARGIAAAVGRGFLDEVAAAASAPREEVRAAALELEALAPDQLLFRAGARALGGLAAAEARQVAQRLPRPLGEILLAERRGRAGLLELGALLPPP